MNMLFFVLPVALLIATGFVVAFIRSAKGGQFDDLSTPAMRVLFDDGDCVAESRKESPGTNKSES